MVKKKAVYLFLISVFLLSFPGAAFAGDTPNRSVFGFSEDGRYAAFEMSGVADGSGFPYLYFGVYDCEKHEWAETPFYTIIEIMEDREYEMGVDLVYERTTEERESIMSRYNIAPFQKGMPVMERGPYSPAITALGVAVNGEDVLFRIAETVGTKTFYDMYTPSGVLITLDKGNGPLSLLERKPAEEIGAFAWDYSIESAVVFQNTIVITVSNKSPGFEGPNTDFMILGDRVAMPEKTEN